MWHSLQAEVRQVGDATFFIALQKQYPFWRWSESPQQYLARLSKTPVRIGLSGSYITVRLQDGTERKYEVPDFKEEFDFLGTGKVFNVQLVGVAPQTLVVVVPDIFVDGNKVPGGKVRFTYKETGVYQVC
jgi:hypothetical protein